jgi:hypothetical protein
MRNGNARAPDTRVRTGPWRDCQGSSLKVSSSEHSPPEARSLGKPSSSRSTGSTRGLPSHRGGHVGRRARHPPAPRMGVTPPPARHLDWVAGQRWPPAMVRALVLVTAFCSLRWGEVTTLRRCDVAGDGSWVRVSSQCIDLVGRGLVRTPPKSRTGARTVTVPAAIRPDVIAHLRDFVAPVSERIICDFTTYVIPATLWRRPERVSGI